MKTVLWYVLGSLVGLYLLKKMRGGQSYFGGVQQSTPSPGQTLAIINGIATPDKGFYGPTTHLVPADPVKYPGWYRTDDGGWVNPDTGGTFSVGSSPEALAAPWADDHPLYIDLSQPVAGGQTPESIAAAAAEDPYGAGAVIY